MGKTIKKNKKHSGFRDLLLAVLILGGFVLALCLAQCGTVDVQVSGNVGVYVFSCLNPDTPTQEEFCAMAATEQTHIDCTAPGTPIEQEICDEVAAQVVPIE